MFPIKYIAGISEIQADKTIGRRCRRGGKLRSRVGRDRGDGLRGNYSIKKLNPLLNSLHNDKASGPKAANRSR